MDKVLGRWGGGEEQFFVVSKRKIYVQYPSKVKWLNF